MDLKGIASRAKQLVDKRGGTDALKEDAGELKDIAKGSGSLTDKAKAAAEAIKDPGEGPGAQAGAAEAPTGPPATRRGRRAGKKRPDAGGSSPRRP